MPYVPISYIGWPEEWLDNGKPKVGEILIKHFVNRYFTSPENLDDDVTLVTIQVKCIDCGFVKKVSMRETEVEWEDFLRSSDRDNMYISLSAAWCNECSPRKKRNEGDKGLPTETVWTVYDKGLPTKTVWDDDEDDDTALIMIWVRCITCGSVKEHFMTDTEESWEYFIYNRDNTYTFLPEPECDMCGNPQIKIAETVREERSNIVEEEYQQMFPKERNLHFGSAIEEYFWKTWKTTFSDFSLIPQYRIGNYYVDFAHIPTKTVIELDGKPYHTTPNQIANDKARQKNLEQQGWRFIRFDGGDVDYHVDRCIIKTLHFLSEAYSGLVADAQYQWDSSPSARLLKRLKERYPNLMFDTP